MENWPAVTLTYSPESEQWSGVVVDDLTTFDGTLFGVLAEIEDYLNTRSN